MSKLEPGRFASMYKESHEMEKEAVVNFLGQGAIRVGQFASKWAPKAFNAVRRVVTRPFGKPTMRLRAGASVPTSTLKGKLQRVGNIGYAESIGLPAAFTGVGAAMTGGKTTSRAGQAAQMGKQFRVGR